jgi:hypothetical protein
MEMSKKSTFEPIVDELAQVAKDFGELLKEMDRTLEACRRALDYLQPPFPGRIMMHWWIRNRRGTLTSYLTPRFTKMRSMMPNQGQSANRGGEIQGSNGTFRKPIWYLDAIPNSYLAARVRKSKSFANVTPAVEDLLNIVSTVAKAREEVVGEILEVGRRQRRLAAKHKDMINYTRAMVCHLHEIAQPYLRDVAIGPEQDSETRCLLDTDRLIRENRTITRHGVVDSDLANTVSQKALSIQVEDIFSKGDAPMPKGDASTG